MAERMKLGVARRVITPKIGCMLYGYSSQPHATGVHDDLTVTVHLFTWQKTKVMLISATVCGFRTDIADELRRILSEQFDVPFEHIVLSATHTHSGPALAGMHSAWGGFNEEYYDQIFKPTLIAAAREALENVEPVTMATAVGESKVGVNRRELTGENKVKLGQNEWGPYNPKMAIMSFQDECGKVKANLISYGAHGTSAGASTLITRDWSGIMTDALEQHTGAVTSFLLGPEGDVGPRNASREGETGIPRMEALGALAAKDALRIFETLSEYKDVTLSVSSDFLRIPLMPRIPYEEACRRSEEISSGVMYNMQSVQYEFFEKVKKTYEEGNYVEREYMEIPQTVFRIGDMAFATFQYEIFSEIGMRIDKEVPDLNVISLVCTNGQAGYFPTRSQICLGGYEIIMFRHAKPQRFVDDADYYLMKETIRNINNLNA